MVDGAIEGSLVCLRAAFQIRGCVGGVGSPVVGRLVGSVGGFWRPDWETGAAAHE